MTANPQPVAGPPVRSIHHLEDVMGTVVTIDVYTTGATAGAEVSRQLVTAQALLQRADAVFSTWQPDTPISRLRRGEITCAQAPAEVSEVLEQCAVARELTGGWFDPWAMPGGIDPTGYVKGWAAQRALSAFRASGICGAIVNAAGDIASFGSLEPGRPFRIGIADPFSPGRLAEVVYLTGAIATSGTYERGDHLIDPHSGRAAARAASASVTGPDLGLADAFATALAVAGEAGLELIEALDGYEALIIAVDGSRRWTQHFPFAPRTGLRAPGRPADEQDDLADGLAVGDMPRAPQVPVHCGWRFSTKAMAPSLASSLPNTTVCSSGVSAFLASGRFRRTTWRSWKPPGRPQVAQAPRLPVDLRKQRDALRQLVAQALPGRQIRVERRGPAALVHRRPPVDETHQVEGPAQDRGVGAHGDGLGVGHVGAVQGLDDAPLPVDALVPGGRRRWWRDPHRAVQVAAADLVDLVLGAAGHEPMLDRLAFTT